MEGPALNWKPITALVVAAAFFTALAACEETPKPTATPVQFNPTAAPVASPTPTPPAGATSALPTSTSAPAITGDASRGQALFAQNGCNACHMTTAATLVGPGLAGIGDRAGTRVPGLSADAYIEQSIRDPGVFLVPGFQNLMLPTFKDLPPQTVADLIAYLKTLR